MKLLTRQQVIDIWNEQSEELRNKVVCPNCRDILTKDTEYYVCTNSQCSKFFIQIPIKEVESEN